MKNLAIILIAVLSVSVFNAQAAEKTKAETETLTNTELTLDTSTEFSSLKIATPVPEGLKKAVNAKLNKGAQKCKTSGEVYMRLCVDQNNDVKIIEMNASKPCLFKYVSNQLSATHVKKPGCLPGQVYMMKVRFEID